MAIIKTIQTPSGITVQDAYVRIEAIDGNKSEIGVTISAYVSQEDSLEKPPFQSERYTFVPDQSEDSERWDKQAYLYLKTLPKFEFATDV